jgi:[protein-PII] uridylyltransferase
MTDSGDTTSFARDRTRRTAQVDRWLAELLGPEPGVALVAVGGYGRRELLPRSDLDVVLLHGGRDDIADIADRIWYPVWDSGAELDHAVRTVPQARRVARTDLKVALGLLSARHVAGDPDLTERLRAGALEDWRAAAPTRLAELHAAHDERTRISGELAFLLEPDLKEARGGLRDVHAIQAVAAAWVAPAPGPKVRTAYEQIIDARHALHEITGRRLDRLVLEEQDEVARALGLLDGDVLLRVLAGAARTVAYAVDHTFRQADRLRQRRPRSRRQAERRPLADGVVEQDGEVVLARAADPADDPVLVLRAAAAAAQAGPAHRMPAAARPVAGPGPRRPAGPARGRPVRGQCVGGAGYRGPDHHADSGLGTGPEPAAAQPAAQVHRGPAPGRGGRPRGRADPRGGPARPAAAGRPAARHRQGLAR